MPRRYRDYPDIFRFWNQVSRVGSLISVIGVLLFFYILWESKVVSRGLVYFRSASRLKEWLRGLFPYSNHSFLENRMIWIWEKSS